MQASAKKVLTVVAIVFATATVLFGLGIALCDTKAGRRVILSVFTQYASSVQRGTVEVKELRDVGFERWLFVEYRVLDEGGREVLRVPEMEAHWDASALFTQGAIVFREAWFRNAHMWLLPERDSGQVSLASAFEVPKGKFFIPLEMKNIHLENNVLSLDLPGKPRLTMKNVEGLAKLHIGEQFRWRMDGVCGRIESPLGKIAFQDMHGRLKSDNPRPLLVDLTVDLAIAHPEAHIEYHYPAIDGQRGKPHLELDFPQL